MANLKLEEGLVLRLNMVELRFCPVCVGLRKNLRGHGIQGFHIMDARMRHVAPMAYVLLNFDVAPTIECVC